MHEIIFVHLKWFFFLYVLRKDRTLSEFQTHNIIYLMKCINHTYFDLLISLLLQSSDCVFKITDLRCSLCITFCLTHLVLTIASGAVFLNIIKLLVTKNLLKSKYFLLHLLDLRHTCQRDLLECVVQDHGHRVCSVLRHNFTVGSMTIKDTEEPVERLGCFRKWFDHLEGVLIYFWRQHLLKLCLLVLAVCVARCGHNLF